jgi:hypothetical protein
MGEKGVWGVLSTPNQEGCGGLGERPREKKNWSFFGSFLRLHFLVFRHIFFADGFLILVKELGLLTNLGQWIRVWMLWDPICILYCKQ